MKDVSIIIVSYNTKELTRNCLHSVFEQTKGVNFEVIVSDNGSTDGSIEMIKAEFPQVILIENGANLGFGAANNGALKIAKGKYVFYLNSDTVLLNNAVKMFFDYWEESGEREKLGALGCWLQDEHGNSVHSGGNFPTYKKIIKEQLFKNVLHLYKSFLKFTHLEKFYFKYKVKVENSPNVGKIYDIDYVTGADLFVKNDKNAFYDEDFFLYFEESDLQLKLSRQGFMCRLIPEPQIIHIEKKRRKEFPITTFSDFHVQRSSILYAKKNLNTKAYLLRFLIWLDWKNWYVQKEIQKFQIKYKNIETDQG